MAYPVYVGMTLLLVLAGVVDSVYLAVSHQRVYLDIGYRSFCAITKSINCDTVSQSHYAVFLGMPVAVWGVFGYLLILALMAISRFEPGPRKRLWPSIFFISLSYSLFSVILAGISTFVVKSYCLMCILTYAINLFLVYYAWLINKRFGSGGMVAGLGEDLHLIARNRAKTMRILLPFFSVWILVWGLYPDYWTFKPDIASQKITNGITSGGDPWIGAVEPSLTIIEYADYRCFQCRKMHFYLRDLIARNPDSIRLVHRHFPMDKKFNPLLKEQVHAGSGRMALLALYAASQGRFWQMNDLLFSLREEHKQVNIKELSKQIGLETKDLARMVGHPLLLQKLQKDIQDALTLGIEGTPAYVIDGKVYTAQLPSEILTPYLE